MDLSALPMSLLTTWKGQGVGLGLGGGGEGYGLLPRGRDGIHQVCLPAEEMEEGGREEGEGEGKEEGKEEGKGGKEEVQEQRVPKKQPPPNLPMELCSSTPKDMLVNGVMFIS